MAKKGFKPVNGFDKNRERASLAGKKSSSALPPDLKEARLLNATLFEDTIYKYLGSDLEMLAEAYKDPKTPARDLVVIKILKMAIENGDTARLNFLLDRTVGRIVDRVEVKAQIQTKTLHDQIMEVIDVNKND